MAVSRDSWYSIKEEERYARKDAGPKQDVGPSQRPGLYNDPGLSKSSGLKRSSGYPLPEDANDKRRRLDNYGLYSGSSPFNDKNLPLQPPVHQPDDYRRESGINIRREDYRRDDYQTSLSNLDPKMDKIVNPKFENPFFNEGHTLPRGREHVSPRRSGEIPRRPEEILRRPEEMPHRSGEMSRRLEEITRQPEEILHRSGEISRRPEEILRRPGEIPRRPEEIPRRPEEMLRRSGEIPHRPEEIPRRPGEIPRRPEEIPRRPEEILRRSGQIPHRPEEIPRRPGEIPPRPEELLRRSGEIPHRPEEIPRRPGEIPRRPEEIPRRPGEIPRRPEEIPRRPGEIPRRPEEIPRRPGEIPRRPEEILRRPEEILRRSDEILRRSGEVQRRPEEILRLEELRRQPEEIPLRSEEMRRINYSQARDLDMKNYERFPRDDYVLKKTYDVNRFDPDSREDLRMNKDPHFLSRSDMEYGPRPTDAAYVGRDKNYLSPNREFKQRNDNDLLKNYGNPDVFRDQYAEHISRTGGGILPRSIVPVLEVKEKREHFTESIPRTVRDLFSQNIVPSLEEKQKRDRFIMPISRTGRDVPPRNIIPSLGEKEKRDRYNEPGSRTGRDVLSQNLRPLLEEKEKRDRFTLPVSRIGRDVLQRNVMPALEEKDKGRYVSPAMLEGKQVDEHWRSKKFDDPMEYSHMRGYNPQKARIEPAASFTKSVVLEVNARLEKNVGMIDAYMGRHAPIPEPPAPPIIHGSFAEPDFSKRNVKPFDGVKGQRGDYEELKKKNLGPDDYKGSTRDGRIEHNIYRGNIIDDLNMPKSISKPDDYRRDDADPYPRNFDREYNLDSFSPRRNYDLPGYQHTGGDGLANPKEFGPEIFKESHRREDYENFRANLGSDHFRAGIARDDHDKSKSLFDVGSIKEVARREEYERGRGFTDRDYYDTLEKDSYRKFLDDRPGRIDEYDRLGIDQGRRSPVREDYYRSKGYSVIDERIDRMSVDDLVREYAEYYRSYGIEDINRIREYILQSLHDRQRLDSEEYLYSQLGDPSKRQKLGDYPVHPELDDRLRRSDGHYSADLAHPDDFRRYVNSNERRSDRVPPHSVHDTKKDKRIPARNNPERASNKHNYSGGKNAENKKPLLLSNPKQVKPLMEIDVKPVTVKSEPKNSTTNVGTTKTNEQTSSSNENAKSLQNNKNKVQSEIDESVTIDKIKSIDGPLGKGNIIVSRLNEPMLQTIERTFSQLKKKYTFENKHDLQSKKWFAKIICEGVELTSESAYMKDTARNAACLLAIQKLRNHYYTLLIKTEYYTGGKELDTLGSIVPVVKHKKKMSKTEYFRNYNMLRVKKAIEDYAKSDSVNDLACSHLFDEQSCEEIKNYARSLKLQVRKYGPANWSFLVLTKKFDLWTIVQGLIDKDVKFLNNYQLLGPGAEII